MMKRRAACDAHDVGGEPAERERDPRRRRQQQLVEVAALDVRDRGDAGDAGRAGDALQDGDRHLEPGVVVDAERPRRRPADRADGHREEEDRDEDVADLERRLADRLAQRAQHQVVGVGRAAAVISGRPRSSGAARRAAMPSASMMVARLAQEDVVERRLRERDLAGAQRCLVEQQHEAGDRGAALAHVDDDGVVDDAHVLDALEARGRPARRARSSSAPPSMRSETTSVPMLAFSSAGEPCATILPASMIATSSREAVGLLEVLRGQEEGDAFAAVQLARRSARSRRG